ncbi:Ger(x)C family spore germination protein [Cohnella sp. GCM10027633]|uniref:Ger(x)C family spore germination protein n=1 Tax=unclassified Cohnella TaxID=2636738 RepID=UPI003635541B
MIRLILAIPAILLLLTACVREEILDRQTLFIACAIDEAPDDGIELTIAAPKYASGKSKAATDVTLSNIGRTSLGIKEIMANRTETPISFGKLSVVLFGRPLATNGLRHELDELLRYPRTSRKMLLAVVDGKAGPLLESGFSKEREKGMFLLHLLRTNEKQGLTPVLNLHEFNYAYVGQGMDPYLPLLTITKDEATISGIALFKGDKLVDTLDVKQMRLMTLLLNRVNHGAFEAKDERGNDAVMLNRRSRAKYRLFAGPNGPGVTIDLAIRGEIAETQGERLTEQSLNKLEERFEAELGAMGTGIIRKFQQKGIDPLGLGEFVRSRTRGWREAEWMARYRALNVRLNVDVKLVETGIMK